jgi:hypothetical protein
MGVLFGARGRARTRIAAVALATPLGLGCEQAPPCYAGEYVACRCSDGRDGFAECGADGAGYAACDCDAGTPGLTVGSGAGGAAGAGGAGGAGGAPKLPFMAVCETNEQCETGLCHPFNVKGPHCSKPCGADGDCPPPSPGCNMMKVCKAP